MLKEILNKHIMIYLSNGNIVKGFVVEMDDIHCKIIEPNNLINIVRLDHISSVKLGGFGNLKKEEVVEGKYIKNNEDLSMPLYNEIQDENQAYGNPFLKGLK